MKQRDLLLSTLIVGLALGTSWAIRGRFGHEQGAAWAGVIGVLAMLLVAKRRDWYQKTFRIALAAAFGWGISGVMSYGILVGYGRAADFGNAYYGLMSLFVLGVLYGFLGGGLVGLTLIESKTNRIPWLSVVTKMVAIGLLTYAVLIMQLEWFMTPPRSEMWAACLGASIALGWFMVRHQYNSALKVAVWAAIGAGFGFAFGNFLQTMGAVSGIKFNFWNVMEYSIGFFGGLGMAYGVFTSPWPNTEGEWSWKGNIIPILFVALFIPFVVWEQSFAWSDLKYVVRSGNEAMRGVLKALALISILPMSFYLLWLNSSRKEEIPGGGAAKKFFFIYTLVYILLSFYITGVLTHPLEQYLYVINFVAILILIPKVAPKFEVTEFKLGKWATYTVLAIVVIAVLAVISISTHDGVRGSHKRFGGEQQEQNN